MGKLMPILVQLVVFDGVCLAATALASMLPNILVMTARGVNAAMARNIRPGTRVG